MQEVHENCGFCVTHTLHDCSNFLKSVQHRGRDAVGIAGVGDTRIDVVKWLGTPIDFDAFNLHTLLKSRHYHTYLGHVRYTTRGNKDAPLEARLAEAHPHVIGGTENYYDSHVIIRDCDAVMVHNGHVDGAHLSGVDNSQLKTACDTEALLHFYYEHGELEVLRRVPGAYSLAIADHRKKDVIVLRDRHGMRPASLGEKDDKCCVASEIVAFWENGGHFTIDIMPGAAYYLDAHGSYTSKSVVPAEPRYCFFEWNYVAHVRSHLNSLSALTARCWLGKALAEEFRPRDAEIVTFLPSCPEMAAITYAEAAGLPFVNAFCKKRLKRAFQGPTKEERQATIRENLYLDDEVIPDIKDKCVVLVDDSIVRGNNAPYAAHLLRNEGGVKKIYLASYTPPIGIIGTDGEARGCLFGVDMPPNDAFVARNRKNEEISKILNMDVGYLSVEGMLRVFERMGMPRENLCTYCIGGRHPFV
jgi:amidophosphoribosyltransferase